MARGFHMGGAGGAVDDSKNILIDGVLNPKYTLSGGYTQENGYVTCWRSGGTYGCEVNMIDLTDMDYIGCDIQNNDASKPIVAYISGGTVYYSAGNTNRQTLILDVRSYTGVHRLQFQINYAGSGSAKIYNIKAQ